MALLLLDTNAVTAVIKEEPQGRQWAIEQRAQGHRLGICQPVYYEVLRGLLWRDAQKQLQSFTERVLPLLQWITLTDQDWTQAAQYWADSRSRGRQISDAD